ncbi:hypothetical protein ACNKHU_21345 [Shigella flexneri]
MNYSGAVWAHVAGGSIVVSHVNDVGFWSFGTDRRDRSETLKTLTMMENYLGTVGAIVGMIAFQLLS